MIIGLVMMFVEEMDVDWFKVGFIEVLVMDDYVNNELGWVVFVGEVNVFGLIFKMIDFGMLIVV